MGIGSEGVFFQIAQGIAIGIVERGTRLEPTFPGSVTVGCGREPGESCRASSRLEAGRPGQGLTAGSRMIPSEGVRPFQIPELEAVAAAVSRGLPGVVK